MSFLNAEYFKIQYIGRSPNVRSRFMRNCFGLACCLGISLGCVNLALAHDDKGDRNKHEWDQSKHEWDLNAHENDGPEGHTYAVHVKFIRGDKIASGDNKDRFDRLEKFDTCFTFDQDYPGTLEILGLDKPLTGC